jgi:DNA invertase Pin-like site-specific DNA recombinase
MKVAIYARCSTAEQHVENQLLELRRYTSAREWDVFAEYVDEGVSGVRESRPRLDASDEGSMPLSSPSWIASGAASNISSS